METLQRGGPGHRAGTDRVPAGLVVGHLILVPLLGWNDPFITSLAFSVMLHIGTLVALLIYFRRRLAAAARRRSSRAPRPLAGGDPDRRLAGAARRRDRPGAHRRVPAPRLEDAFREQIGLVAVLLVVGAAILWLAERIGLARPKLALDLSIPTALGIGVGPGPRAHPGHQPVRDLDLGRPVPRPRPRGGRALQLPDGDADHGRRRPRTRRSGRPRRGVAASRSAPLAVGVLHVVRLRRPRDLGSCSGSCGPDRPILRRLPDVLAAVVLVVLALR